MQVEVRFKESQLGDAVRNYVMRRTCFALGRLAGRIGRVTVRISDVNGARGGIDQCCQITAELVRSGNIVVEQVDANLYAAIDRACERAARSSRRVIQRARAERTHHESIRQPVHE